MKSGYNLCIFFITMSMMAFSTLKTSGQCTGIDMNGSASGPIWNSFDSYSDVLAGETFNEFITLTYNLAAPVNCPNWKIKVRALGNFTNGSANINPQYISIRFNRVDAGAPSAGAMGVSNVLVPLNTTEVTLINSNAAFATPPTYYAAHKFDMVVAGGSHLLVGSGTYTAILRFTLYNSSNIAISTKEITTSFNVVFSNTCTGTVISGYSNNQYTFNNYAQQMAGATANEAVTLQYAPNGATCRGWTVKARVAGNFVNGANTVAPQNISLKFNRVSSGSPTASAIGVTNTPVALSNSDAVLINSSGDSFNGGTVHKFDLVIAGGIHLLVPNGSYTGGIVFSLYNAANQLISTTTINATFQVQSSANSFSLVLQNTADLVNMNFSAPGALASGVSVSKVRGMKIVGYGSHQVIVKTSTANLTSTSSSYTIPVSAVSLELTKYTTTNAGIVVYTRSLSASDQVFITNPVSHHTQQEVEYNIRFSTAPGNSVFSGANGTFSTSVVFIAIPN
ncbi:hypothetical protein [Pedobacter psychroterrae]|uniref:CUB-like protein n=1 Tax=Pedobacter psychroterrae TaxID=2530453 RepID=A0A4R0N9K7_9SPHI|nr:hypothetical protein [Pedobacter psychroterrae]TCC96755.1 hypothetical protein EZ437_21240 [Pedobacter psychroterrae]